MRVNKVSKVGVVRERPKRVVPAIKTDKNRNSRESFKSILESKLKGNNNE